VSRGRRAGGGAGRIRARSLGWRGWDLQGLPRVGYRIRDGLGARTLDPLSEGLDIKRQQSQSILHNVGHTVKTIAETDWIREAGF
jgi:hypothetical protein